MYTNSYWVVIESSLARRILPHILLLQILLCGSLTSLCVIDFIQKYLLVVYIPSFQQNHAYFHTCRWRVDPCGNLAWEIGQVYYMVYNSLFSVLKPRMAFSKLKNAYSVALCSIGLKILTFFMVPDSLKCKSLIVNRLGKLVMQTLVR